MAIVNPAELFARSQGVTCGGPERCHWCAGPCGPSWPHDDPTPGPYNRSWEGAKCPSGRYVCEGCRLYRRPSVTAWWLSGGYQDRQCLSRLSWWLVPGGLRAVREADRRALWDLLLTPPPTFCLALHSGDKDVKVQLHQAVVNDHRTLAADTVLYFTLDNLKYDFTVYELKQSCRHEVEGKSPGVQTLHRVLGRHVVVDDRPHVGKRGRPPKDEDDDVRRVVSEKVSDEPARNASPRPRDCR